MVLLCLYIAWGYPGFALACSYGLLARKWAKIRFWGGWIPESGEIWASRRWPGGQSGQSLAPPQIRNPDFGVPKPYLASTAYTPGSLLNDRCLAAGHAYCKTATAGNPTNHNQLVLRHSRVRSSLIMNYRCAPSRQLLGAVGHRSRMTSLGTTRPHRKEHGRRPDICWRD